MGNNYESKQTEYGVLYINYGTPEQQEIGGLAKVSWWKSLLIDIKLNYRFIKSKILRIFKGE